MKFLMILCLCAIASAGLPSCGLLKFFKTHDPKAAAPSEAPQLIGRIASIPADKRFVLIQSYDHSKLQAGTLLTTRGDPDRSANLRITGEALGPFTAADLQSGLVEVGDAVYSHHVPKPEPPPTAPEPVDNQFPSP
jgi:hypothetical protein